MSPLKDCLRLEMSDILEKEKIGGLEAGVAQRHINPPRPKYVY